jgi:hypothetical protein
VVADRLVLSQADHDRHHTQRREHRGPRRTRAVLVRLHSGNFSFSDAQDNGADLRFVGSDDKTPLTFHIESYDPLLGVATIWVDVPDFPAGSAKQIWLYYGNKKAPPAGDAAQTFDPDYALVYHFDQAAGAPPKDATAYGNNALTAPSGIDDGAIIGKGARFSGTAAIAVPPSSSLAIAAGGSFTFSAWVKSDVPQAAAGSIPGATARRRLSSDSIGAFRSRKSGVRRRARRRDAGDRERRLDAYRSHCRRENPHALCQRHTASPAPRVRCRH